MAKIVTTSQANAGDPVEATLDKNELKLISKVANDAVFSQESNWGLVSCIFKHKDSSRRFVAAFKGSETEIMSIRPSMLAGDNFELKKIIIAKPNRELLVVNKPEIPSYADYDFTLKGSGTGTLLLSRDFSSPASISASESIPNVFGGSYEFINGNLKFTITDPNATQYGGYIDYLYIGAIPGFIPTTAHKLRIHIAAHSGGVHLVTAIGQEWTTPKRTTAAQLSAAVGSYIDIEGIGSGDNIYKFTLEPICRDDSNQNTPPGSLSISKVELIKL